MSSTLKKLNSGMKVCGCVCHQKMENLETGNTVKRLNVVLSFDGTDSDRGLEMVKDALEFLAFTMKKRETGPVGGLLLDYLKNHADGLYRHITKQQPSVNARYYISNHPRGCWSDGIHKT